jgi:beta-D-xylosidase 4
MPAAFANSSNFTDMSMTNGVGRSYRYYTGADPALWSFGFGLSYTTWKLDWPSTADGGGDVSSDLHLAVADPTTEKTVAQTAATIDFKLSNTGTADGDEVVQAYWRVSNSSSWPGALAKASVPFTAHRSLFWFKRVHLSKGGSTQLSFNVTSIMLTHANSMGDRVTVEGAYDVIISRGHGEELVRRLQLVV